MCGSIFVPIVNENYSRLQSHSDQSSSRRERIREMTSRSTIAQIHLFGMPILELNVYVLQNLIFRSSELVVQTVFQTIHGYMVVQEYS